LKKLPLGIQNFRKIVDGNYVYVDKTRYIYDLISNASYYFLSRPRRFGKSLLLDTIAEAFSGDRELFKDLWIYDSDYSFEKHPVIRLDMSNIANKTPETLENELTITLKQRVAQEGFDVGFDSPSAIFKTLIEMLHEKYSSRVVVLIDEYDKPILDHLQDTETAEANREVLRGFYGILKSMDPFLRFTFITGVTKFTKTSIFSGLNNLLDITMTTAYSNICGYVGNGISAVERSAEKREPGSYAQYTERSLCFDPLPAPHRQGGVLSFDILRGDERTGVRHGSGGFYVQRPHRRRA
jgi:hypothetical protein